ncbi:hypothetical protein TNCV_4064051 [Trichonephila clavipes]|nr:hypothetical protein TNCV_4064051 [Trichonephila clavipes]
MVIDLGFECHEFKPSDTEDPPCKSVEAQSLPEARLFKCDPWFGGMYGQLHHSVGSCWKYLPPSVNVTTNGSSVINPP